MAIDGESACFVDPSSGRSDGTPDDQVSVVGSRELLLDICRRNTCTCLRDERCIYETPEPQDIVMTAARAAQSLGSHLLYHLADGRAT